MRTVMRAFLRDCEGAFFIGGTNKRAGISKSLVLAVAEIDEVFPQKYEEVGAKKLTELFNRVGLVVTFFSGSNWSEFIVLCEPCLHKCDR